jgi:hypothetical protein
VADFSHVDDDELVDEICTWAGRVAAGTAHLLALVAELDRREAWVGTGLLSCAHWLSWRIGLSLGTAREWVRVARRLEELPEVSQAFSAGRMSWSQARAVSRVAEVGDAVDWVELARYSTAAQLEKLARGVRRARLVEQAQADPEATAWSLRTRRRYDEDGNLTLTIYAPAQFAPVIEAGIEAQRAELDRQRQAEAAERARVDVSAETPAREEPESRPVAQPVAESTSEPEPEPGARPEPAAVDLSAGTPGGAVPVAAQDPAQDSAQDSADDIVAAGWPPGTTAEQVRNAFDHFHRFTASLRDGEFDPELRRDGPSPDDPAPAPPSADVPAEAPPAPAAPAGPPRATEAEALLAFAQRALEQERVEQPTAARRSRIALTAQIDPLSGWGRLRDGELLPPCSLKHVLKTLPGRGGTVRLRPLTEADLRRHDLGRSRREVSAGLRELLGGLDGERCRFPGCTRHRKLHAHHVRFWSDGGPTDLANLVLVCARHHTLVHSQGFQLVLHPDRRLEVHTADGVPVLHHPAQPWGDPQTLDPHRRVSADTLPPVDVSARLDLGYAVNVLMLQSA